MSRTDAYTFLMLGRNLERADMTSRIVDVRSAQILPADASDLGPFPYHSVDQCAALPVRSAHVPPDPPRAGQPRRIPGFRLAGCGVSALLPVLLRQIELGLRTLPRSSGVLDTLAGAHRFLAQVSFGDLDQAGLHQLIDHLQVYLIGVHASIAQAYFPALPGNARRPMLQSQDGGRTLPLFADAP